MPSLIFPARFEFLNEIRELVAQIARENDFDAKEVYALQLAADEAATNVIEHAYDGVSNAVLEFGCEMRDGALVITLRDQGRPFDMSKVKEPDMQADLNKRQIGGLGIYLMRKLMDEVEYRSDSTGNLLTMIKRKG